MTDDMDARLTDDMVRKAGDILLGYVNAPEQVIYGAAREMLEASLAIAMARENAEKVERMRVELVRLNEWLRECAPTHWQPLPEPPEAGG